MCTCIHVYTYIHIYICIYIYTYIHIYSIHTYIYVYTYIHIYCIYMFYICTQYTQHTYIQYSYVHECVHVYMYTYKHYQQQLPSKRASPPTAPTLALCEWVMSHTWMSHVTHVNESCRTCKWVMSHTWMSHVIFANQSWMRHANTCVTHGALERNPCLLCGNESCHTRAWVMSHVRRSLVTHVLHSEPSIGTLACSMCMIMSHVTHVNEPFHTDECVLSWI